MQTKTSIHALIKLMSDTNRGITEMAEATLLNYGEEIIPELLHLEEICVASPNEMENISVVLTKLRFHKVEKALSEWRQSKDKDLTKAIFIIDSYQFPDLEYEYFKKQLDFIKQQCWLELHPNQTSFEKITAINKTLFEGYNFFNTNKIFPSPFEVFTHSVLDTKAGTDFSLGVLYSILAQSLHLPVYGVISKNENIPFMLAFLDKNNILSLLNRTKNTHNNHGVLFYISAGLRGLIIEPQQLKELYDSEKISSNAPQFEPSPNSLIVKNYLQHLKNSFTYHAQYRYKAADMDKLIALL